MTSDPYDLQRFLEAQKPVYGRACAELRNGRKDSHWMWFIFPQMHGLGESAMAMKFAIHSRGEAQAYLDHNVLGTRLRECTQIVAQIDGFSIQRIFGYPDWLKFHSCMTLFELAVQNDSVFRVALDKYFSGEMDELTVKLLQS